MKIKNPKLEIDPSNPFAGDKLGRHESAEVLSNIIESVDEPFVLSINAGWGKGKSTFLEMWKYYLESKGYTTLRFNAWENDYAEDPMVAFIGEMSSTLKESNLKGSKKSEAEKRLKSLKKAGGVIARRMIPAAAKIATAGVLDLEAINETIIGDAIGKLVEDQIDKYEEEKKSLAEFKETLRDYAEALSENSNGKPLIFIIDELDRCRPTYAIELLERLKHFFSVNGIVFVLAIDKEQLGHSIKSVYGNGMDADGYLRRFIDLEYQLPDLGPGPGSTGFSSYLLERYELREIFDRRANLARSSSEEAQLLYAITAIAKIYDLSLRDLEHCFSKLALVLRLTPARQYLHPIPLAFLLAIKTKKNEIYKGLLSGNVTGQQLLEFILKSRTGVEFIEDNTYGVGLEAFLLAGVLEPYQHEVVVKELTDAMNSGKVTAKQGARYPKVIEYIRTFAGRNLLHDLAGKIELSGRFIA